MAVDIYHIPKIVLELSLDTGGDLPDATTYYFIGYYQIGEGYYQPILGEASDEVSITTTAANQKIVATWKYDIGEGYVYGCPWWGVISQNIRVIIKWDNYTMMNGAEYYKFCNLNDPAISDEFQDSYGHRKWCNSYAGEGFMGSSVDLTTANMYIDGQGRGFHHPQVSWQYEWYPLYTNLDINTGGIAIDITGEDNTEDDLVNALQACGYNTKFELHRANDYQDVYAYHSITLFGGIIGDGSGTIDKCTFTFLIGKTDCYNLMYNYCNFIGHGLQVMNWLNLVGRFTDCSYYHNGNTFVIDSLVEVYNFSPWNAQGCTAYGSLIGFYFKNQNRSQYRYYLPEYVIEDTTFDNCYLLATGSPNALDGENETFTWQNVTFLNNDGPDIYISWNYGAGKDIIQTFNVYGIISDRDTIRVRWYQLSMGSLVTIFNMYQPVNFTVTNANGDLLDGASIIITDTVGNTVSGYTTDGLLTLNLLTYTVEYDEEDSDGLLDYSKTTDLKPFTLLISSNNHHPYTEIITGLSGETDKFVALQSTAPVYIEENLTADLEEDEIYAKV